MKVLYFQKGLTVHIDSSGKKTKVLPGNLHGFDILNESLERLEYFNGCFKDFLRREGREVACLAIGFFDGVHLGHQEVIKSMERDASEYGAESVVITFDRHPLSVISPSSEPPMITTMAHKMKLLSGLGIRYTILLPFDNELARLSAERFVECLNCEIGRIKTICVGNNFLFGHNREGDVKLLKMMGEKLGFTARGIKSVSIEGVRISSTRIREAIKKGDLKKSSQMLGRDYSIFCRVIRGRGLGKKIGFPTANLDIRGLVLPPCGVYAARVQFESREFKGVLNLGYKPTISQERSELSCEVHIFDFDYEAYDKGMEVIFVEKIRDEKRFSSIEELRRQIQEDIKTTLGILEN